MTIDCGFQLKWDPKNLEIKTKSVQRALEPLVIQVTTLVNSKNISTRKKGCSKRAIVLVATVEEAIKLFIQKGELIAKENDFAFKEIMDSVEEVQASGKQMSDSSRQFADDPCSSNKKAMMVKSARTLLSAVTRLLIVADMVDIYNLLKNLKQVEDNLDLIKNVNNHKDLMDHFDTLSKNIKQLYNKVGERQKDINDPAKRDALASARASLKKNRDMLFTTTKAYLRHPELLAAKANRDYALGQMTNAVDLIDKMTREAGGMDITAHSYKNEGVKDLSGNVDLASAIQEFQKRIAVQPSIMVINSTENYSQLEQTLEGIINGAMGMAESPCTRDETRDKILESCNKVRNALQDLLSECINHNNTSPSLNEIEGCTDTLEKSAEELKRQLRKAVVDHVSDSFLETGVPLLILVEAARAGSNEGVEKGAQLFTEHANKLIEVAELACSLSTQVEGIKLVRMAAVEIKNLYPQVINAARILAARSDSKPAYENLNAFHSAWEMQVRILTEAVDDITTINDFLCVSESHILEDINKCISAFREGDSDLLDRSAGAIRGRSRRVCNVVGAEMDNYEPGVYTQRVLQAVSMMQQQLIPFFAQRVEAAFHTLSTRNSTVDLEILDAEENEFIEANRLIYDGIRDIRGSVLMNKSILMAEEGFEPGMLEKDGQLTDLNNNGNPNANLGPNSEMSLTHPGDDEYYFYYEEDEGVDDEEEECKSRSSILTGSENNKAQEHLTSHGKNSALHQINNYHDPRAMTSDRALMRQLPQEARAKIQQEIRSFREQKAILDKEVSKWEDAGNDIIVIAKHMCMIMMEMTDFTRGRGPLKTTMDVINAAQKISEVGKKLDKLARHIANDCPESSTKQDLLAYLQRIDLYCQQLAITSKVKADVSNIGGEIVVSGLDSVTSLITASKNLMNTVVLIVKASYVASTKYTKFYRQQQKHQASVDQLTKKPPLQPLVGIVWKMKPPEKKPLVRVERPKELGAIIRRGSQKRRVAPIKALNEFHQNF